MRPERLSAACRTALPLVVLAVLVASTVPLPPGPLPGIADKLEHALVFALLTALAAIGHPRLALWRRIAPLLLGYGLLIECIQWLLPWREFSLLDWAADGIGILLCALPVVRARRARLPGQVP